MKCPQCGFDHEGWLFEDSYEKLCVGCGILLEEGEECEPIEDEPLPRRNLLSRFTGKLFGWMKKNSFDEDILEEAEDSTEDNTGIETPLPSDAYKERGPLVEGYHDADTAEVITNEERESTEIEQYSNPDDFLIMPSVILKADALRDEAHASSEMEQLCPKEPVIEPESYKCFEKSESLGKPAVFEEYICDEGQIKPVEYETNLEGHVNPDEHLEIVPGKGATEYLRIKSLMPDDEKNYDFKQLGELLQKEGHHKKAIDVLKKAVEIKPDDAEAWGELAESYYQGPKNLPKAIDCSRKALAIDDSLIGIHCTLYLALLYDGQYRPAKKGFLAVTRMIQKYNDFEEESKEKSEAILFDCLNGLYNDRKEVTGKLLEEITDIIDMIELERICFN